MAACCFESGNSRKPISTTLWRIDQACFDPQLAYSRPEMAFYMRRPGSFTLVAEAEGSEVPDNGILGFIVAETRRKSGHIITIDVVAEAGARASARLCCERRKISCCGRVWSR